MLYLWLAKVHVRLFHRQVLRYTKCSLGSFAPVLPAFPHIHQRLEPVVLSRDPLHVVRLVSAPSTQRNHMIDMPALAGPARAAGGGAGVLGAEGADLGAVARYFRLCCSAPKP